MTIQGYIVEHMEEELFEWCILEYQHIQNTIGHERFILTNMGSICDDTSQGKEFTSKAHKFMESVINIFPKERICLLDSEATLELRPEDANSFDYILAGGILGDVDENDPDRTAELRKHGYPTRHLGHEQMTTDTAIITAWHILNNQITMKDLFFVDRPTFVLGKYEQIHMPFRYLSQNQDKTQDHKSPLIPPGMMELWKSPII
jgi:ribosome biogenesis SPOUT family RNA methylase Rps3